MQKKPHEPYRMDALKTLMQRAFTMGAYTGTHDLLKITIRGAFEGFSGRSSEDWETHFFVEFRIPEGDKVWSSRTEQLYTADGRTLQEACEKIIAEMKADDQ